MVINMIYSRILKPWYSEDKFVINSIIIWKIILELEFGKYLEYYLKQIYNIIYNFG